MNVCWLSIKKAPIESLRWHKYSAKLIFYMLIDSMHCTHVQSRSIFNLYWTLLNKESIGPELSVHIMEVSIIIVEVDYSNSGFSGTK